MPEDQRAVALADASITSPFLEKFGRSSRDTGLESDRNNRPTAAQRLHLLNSSHVRRKIETSPKLRALLRADRRKPENVVRALPDDPLADADGRRAARSLKTHVRDDVGRRRRCETSPGR